MARANDRSTKDKEMAAVLKARKIERRTGRCCICYSEIGNDTFGGRSVFNHYSQHARGYEEKK